MKLLALDTSTTLATVALTVDNHVYQAEQAGVRQHALRILPMIDGLLSEANCVLSQLDGIVFGRGPGSFTGLRIACSIAKGLAYAHDLPLYPVSSLATIAEEVFKVSMNTDVLVVIDARMQQLYWCYFKAGESKASSVEAVSSPEVITSFLESLKKPDKVVLAGVDFEDYWVNLPAHIIKPQVIYPRAETMIEMVLAGKVSAVSMAEALPVYIRNRVTQEGGSHG